MNSTPEREIVPPSAASWEFAEDHSPLSDAVRKAREEVILSGAAPISQGVAAALETLAAAVRARHVVEVGTAMGASALSLLAGMLPDGILTSIDAEAENQFPARGVLAAAGYATSRFRLIAGRPLDVLPKLNLGSYDLVFINGDKLEYVEYVAAAERLLRPGGMLIVHDVLWYNTVADPSDESDETIIIREALQAVTDSGAFRQALLPVGNGLLVAVKTDRT